MASGDPPDTNPKPSPLGRRKGRKISQKEQSERFIETARELEADETGGAFNRAIDKLVRKAD